MQIVQYIMRGGFLLFEIKKFFFTRMFYKHTLSIKIYKLNRKKKTCHSCFISKPSIFSVFFTSLYFVQLRYKFLQFFTFTINRNRCRQYPGTDLQCVLRHRQHPGRLQGNQTSPRLPTSGIPVCLHLLLQHDLQSCQRAPGIPEHGLVQSARVRGSVAVWPHFRDCSLGTPLGVWSLLAQRDHRRKMLQERANRSCLKHGSIFLSQTAFFKTIYWEQKLRYKPRRKDILFNLVAITIDKNDTIDSRIGGKWWSRAVIPQKITVSISQNKL